MAKDVWAGFNGYQKKKDEVQNGDIASLFHLNTPAPTPQEQATKWNSIVAPTFKPKYDFTKDTMPIVAKSNPTNVSDLANNSKDGLTLDSLMSSAVPTWQKVISSPLALIGSANKAVVNSPLGSRFIGASGGITMDKGTPIQPVGSAGKIGNFLATQAGGLANLKLQGGDTNLFAGGNMITNALPQASKIAQYGANAIGQGANLGYYSALDTGFKGGSNTDILKSAGTGALMGAGLGTLGKGITDLAPKALDLVTSNKDQAIANAFKIKADNIQGPKVFDGKVELKPIEIKPTEIKPMGNKLTPFDTKGPAAETAYNDAIQTIQNRFGTNKLIPSEIPLIKSELGIDLPKLIDNIGLKTTMNDVRGTADKSMLAMSAGVKDVPNVDTLRAPLKTTLKQPTNDFKLGDTNTPATQLTQHGKAIAPKELLATDYSKINDETTLTNHVNEIQKQMKNIMPALNLQQFAQKLEEAKKQLSDVQQLKQLHTQKNTILDTYNEAIKKGDTYSANSANDAVATINKQINDLNAGKYKAPVDVNGNPLPDPKIVSSGKTDKTTLLDKFNKFYTPIVDRNKSIGDFSKVSKDKTYTLATNSANQKNVSDYIMTEKLVNKQGEVVGKSLKETLKDIPKDKENSFMQYALEKHNIDRAREGKPVIPNHTSEQSQIIVDGIEKNNPTWANQSKSVTDWINTFMKHWGVDAGTLDKGLYEANKKTYPNYIPSNRDFTSLEQGGSTGGGTNTGFVNQTVPIKRATGSSRDIVDPRENIANMVMRTVKTAKNNEVAQNMVSSVRNNPQKLKPYAEIVSEPKGNVSNIVRVLEDGQPTYLKINDLGLLKAMEGLNKTDVGTAEAAARKVTGLFKQLITQKNPVFAIRNIARDVPTAYVNGSENNPIKFAGNLLKAGKDVVTNSEKFQQYKAMGGGGSNFFDSGNPAKSIKELTGGGSKLGKVLKAIPNGIEKFNNITESAPRLAEFKTVLKKTGDVDKALYASSELTTNFSRGGNFTKHADSVVPYLNAGVQGLDKEIRQFKTKPIQTLAKGAIGITAPTLAFNYLNKDNENYKNLDNRTKDNYFLIPNGDTFIKIPKSRELGVLFGSLAERTLRAAQGDKKAFKDYGNTVATNFAPSDPIENNIISPAFINLPKNKDFANRAIVPQGMLQDGRSPKYQYDEKTSELAKALGNVANLSPKKIDYIIKSYTGVVGQMGLPALTKTPGKTPLQNALKPVTSQFISDPLYSNAATSDFYDNLDKLKQKASNKNISGNIPSKTVTNEEALRNLFTKASTQMSKLNKQISTTSDEQKIKDLRKAMLDIANKTNKLVK